MKKLELLKLARFWHARAKARNDDALLLKSMKRLPKIEDIGKMYALHANAEAYTTCAAELIKTIGEMKWEE